MMKKKIIIGLASAGLAVIPLAETFAAGTYCNKTLTDTFAITISDACNFSRTAQTLSTSMNPNALNSSMTSTYKMVCNDVSGYSVSATFTKMTGTGADLTYSCLNGSTLCTVTTTTAAGSGTWTAVKGSSSTSMSSSTTIAGKWDSSSSKYTGGVLMSGSGPTTTSGTSQQISYRIGTATTQAAGSYSATATYTAVQNS